MKLRIKLLRIGFALFGLLLVLIIGALGWRVLSIRSAQQAYDKRLAEIKANGQVVDLAGIERLHKERASGELAAEWNALFEELSKPEFIEASMTLPYLGEEGLVPAQVPIRGQPWEEEAKARKFLVDCMQLRDKLRKLAVKSSRVYFPIETSGESFGDCQAHYAARRAMKLLVLDGHMALRYNATATAIEDIRALLGLSKLFLGEPSLMGLLIDNGTARAALEIVQSAVEQRALSESQLKELIATLQAVKIPQEHLWLAAEGERGSLIATLDDMGKRLGIGRYMLGSPRGRLAALDLIDHMQAVKFDNLDEAMRAIDIVENESDKYVARMGWVTSADHIAPFKLVGLFAASASLVEQHMHVRLAELALTIQLYRAQQGRLPETLSDLSSLGVDLQRLMPMGGKPFGYRLSEDKSTAELWGFHILLRNLRTPDEPLPIEGQDSNNSRWLWKL